MSYRHFRANTFQTVLWSSPLSLFTNTALLPSDGSSTLTVAQAENWSSPQPFLISLLIRKSCWLYLQNTVTNWQYLTTYTAIPGSEPSSSLTWIAVTASLWSPCFSPCPHTNYFQHNNLNDPFETYVRFVITLLKALLCPSLHSQSLQQPWLIQLLLLLGLHLLLLVPPCTAPVTLASLSFLKHTSLLPT